MSALFPPQPWTRASLLAWFETAEPVTSEQAGRIWRAFLFDENRYRFDFGPCKGPGWRQYDTDQDAWYFGVWVHLAEMLVVTFAEGDLSIWVADDVASLSAELDRMAAFYGEPPPAATVLDPDAGTITKLYDPRPSLDEEGQP